MYEGDYLTTPENKIKVGQICRDELGNPALSIKRGKRNEYEKVPIPYLIEELSAVLYEMSTIKEYKIE